MLKACWDCIAGNVQAQSDHELVYGSQLNGKTHSAPPWPEEKQNEIMFILPRKLNSRDKINVSGIMMSSPQILSINLMSGDSYPDQQNIACQFEARFPNGSSREDNIVIKVIENGVEEIISGDHETTQATELFTGDNFTFSFVLRVIESYDEPIVEIYIDGSYVQQLRLKHDLNNVRFLMLKGDIEKVEKLDFHFS